MLYQKINVMYKGTRTERLTDINNTVNSSLKIGESKIITPVKTDKGTKKIISTDTQIPGNYKDYALENLIELGINLNKMTLSQGWENAFKEKVEFYSKQFLENLNNKQNE